MTKDEALQAFEKCKETNSREEAHWTADHIVLRYLEANGHKEISDGWKSVYEAADGFWWS